MLTIVLLICVAVAIPGLAAYVIREEAAQRQNKLALVRVPVRRPQRRDWQR